MIEDSRTDALLIKGMLADAGEFTQPILHAGDLSTGLQLLQEKQVAVILLDLSLPDSSGFETFQCLQPHACDIPIIVLTGSRDRRLALYAIKHGAQDYLVKDEACPLSLGKAIQYAVERKQAEQRIHFQASLLDQVQNAVFATDRNDRIIYWNRFARRLYQWPDDQALGRRFSELIVPEEGQALLTEIHQALSNKQTWEGELELKRRDGSLLPTQLTLSTVSNAHGQISGYVGIASDIGTRKEIERKLEHNAFHDPLTGLPNRLLFSNRLSHAIARGAREGGRYAVMVIDLDRFKMINDSLGHLVGDELLIQFSRRVESCLRPQDTLARLGGDEFTILLDDLQHSTDAIRVAERIHEKMAQPFYLDNTEVHTSASIGITFGTANYKEPSHALRDADIAMYRAKNHGKGCHVVFENGMHDRATMQLKHEARLRHAVEKGEFELKFQPIIDLHTGQCLAAEAQIHWNSPNMKRFSPQEFLALADDSGLIISLGQTLLDETCRALRAWQELTPQAADLTIHIRLTARQFCHRGLIEQLRSALQRYELEGWQLTLEITESVLHEHPVLAAAILADLRDLGIGVCIGDFGTGHTSLSQLHRYPLDALKIGQSFLSNLDSARPGQAVIQAILQLGQSLGLQVIAESVQTERHLARLTELGCHRAQGEILQPSLNPSAMGQYLLRMVATGGFEIAPRPASTKENRENP